MSIDLVPFWAAILALAVFMYVLLDGFDLGVGILYGRAANEHARDVMMNSVAPVWDANETWLVLGGVALLSAFPLAFAILLPALYFPLLLMVLGLVFRGVAFEFRAMPGTDKSMWGRAFFWGSLVATFMQGVVLGNIVEGIPVQGRQFAGDSLFWIRGFALLVGLGLVAGYALLGACWLVLKTEGALQQWARRRARWLLLGTLAFIALVSIWTPTMQPRVAARWFSWPNIVFLAPVPIITVALALWLWRSLDRGRDHEPFVAATGLFVMCYLGIAISIWPMIIPYEVTLHAAAAPPTSQAFLAIGAAFFIPVILGYVGWSYWVFRGKVRADIGYHAT